MALTRAGCFVPELSPRCARRTRRAEPRAAFALRVVRSRRDSGAAGAAVRQGVTRLCQRAGPRWAAGAASLDCAADDGCRDEGAVTVRDDLDSLLQVLPPGLRSLVSNHPRRDELVEVVLDLGRSPEIRGAQGYREVLRAEEITSAELEAAASAVGNFGGDNRAGIEGARPCCVRNERKADLHVPCNERLADQHVPCLAGTLHRISAIRNRRGVIVGLTCRVGRAVSGHADMVRDILNTRESMLFVGCVLP